MQAEVAIERACREWGANPERLWRVCGEAFEVADRSVWDKVLAAGGDSWIKRTPEATSEFPPDLDLTDEKEDPDSPTATAKKVIYPSTPPMEEDNTELEEIIARLRGPALQQVQRYVAMLARMRKVLTPSARIRMIKDLGWHLGPTHKTGGHEQAGHHQGREVQGSAGAVQNHAGEDGQPGRQLCRRRGAPGEEERGQVAGSDQGGRAATAGHNYSARTAVAGGDRKGETCALRKQLTTTGDEMTKEEHVATAETHL